MLMLHLTQSGALSFGFFAMRPSTKILSIITLLIKKCPEPGATELGAGLNYGEHVAMLKFIIHRGMGEATLNRIHPPGILRQMFDRR